jgi:rhodanese-related sulfurtransferase
MMAAAGDELTVIDVRTAEEYANGHIDGAINLDVQGGGFSASIAALDPAAPYIVYCHSGRRSAIAAATMVAAGFTQVHDMGGIQAWIDAGLPIVAA